MTAFASLAQPPVAPERLAAASGHLKRYRIMAFATGVVLLLGCLALILKAAGVPHMEPGTGFVWVAHGYLYLIFLLSAFFLSRKAKWPPVFTLVTLLCGTIPILSFWAEHRATKRVRAEHPETVPAEKQSV